MRRPVCPTLHRARRRVRIPSPAAARHHLTGLARRDPRRPADGRGQRVVEGVFDRVARWRSGRAVHTAGVLLDAHLALDPCSWTGAALGGPTERPAVVRLSRSVSLPGGWGDLLGVGLRVGTGGDGLLDGLLDVLFGSAGRRDLDHMVLLPSSGWWSRPYSTILPYRVNGRPLLLGLVPPGLPGDADPATVAAAVGQGPLTLVVTEQAPAGRRRRIGALTLTGVRGEHTGFSFDPVLNHPTAVRPVRPLLRLRELAYTGSRRGRRADPAGLRRAP